MPGGVVSWPVYDGFQIGEKESSMARNAFEAFIPISTDGAARKNIITDFFDLLAAVAAHGKLNGLGGRKLPRLAGWWAFEHSDHGNGFEGGYKSWTAAANATNHLFFAYLRTLSPEEHPSMSLIERIPRSLQALLASTEYPPQSQPLLHQSTPRVVMLVDSVSPTPFALLRRAKGFEYRHSDALLRQYAEFEDPLDALTDECKRVLYAISSTNSSAAKSRHNHTAKPDESWSSFLNRGFADMDENALPKVPSEANTDGGPLQAGPRSEPRSRNVNQARPTTPSWADFLSSGFAEDDVDKNATTLLLPPDKQLPRLGTSVTTPSHIPEDDALAPGELANITDVDLDDSFWWVWMTSLASEEPAERKAVFGRCAVIETSIWNGRWLIIEEQLKGASPDPEDGLYVPKKQGFFSTLTKRGKPSRQPSVIKTTPSSRSTRPHLASPTPSKTSLAPDQQSRIKQAAAAMKRQDDAEQEPMPTRRGRAEDAHSTKTNSMLTLGLSGEAGPAMKWANAYDKNNVRAQYLGDNFAGTGLMRDNTAPEDKSLAPTSRGDVGGGESSIPPALSPDRSTFPADAADPTLTSVPAHVSTSVTTNTAEDSAMPHETNVAIAESPHDTEQTPTAPSSTYLNYGKEALAPQTPVAPPTATTIPSAMYKELGVSTPSSPTAARFERKPVPSTRDHPAFRIASPVTSGSPKPKTSQQQMSPAPVPNPAAAAAAAAAQRAMGVKNNDAAAEQARLKKQAPSSNGGGLKKLFGRKQKDSRPTDPASNNLAPPENGLSRRISMMRKKPMPPAQSAALAATTPIDSPVQTSHSAMSELDAAPRTPAYDASTTELPSSPDTRQADQEFARFDQDFVEQTPITPVESEHEIVAPQAHRPFDVNEHLASQVAPPEGEYDGFVTPAEQAVDDAQSETTMEEPTEAAAAQDRWAIIRENAARRAARASEEQSSMQSRPSQSQRTDDGETSGEESKCTTLFPAGTAANNSIAIESRVARIKARVAELTGGMDTSGVRR